MKESINNISAYWIGQFLICIKESLNEAQFRSFTLFIDNGSDFDSVRENKGYFQDLPIYLELLRKNGLIGSLVKNYILENDIVDSEHPFYKPFKIGIEKEYRFDLETKIDTELAISNKYDFNSNFLLNNSFPFLNRKNFRNKLVARLITDNTYAKVIFVKGKPRSGMSYLSNYLYDMSRISGIYELIEIDVPYYLDNEENLNGVSLAKTIAAKFDFEDDLEDNRGDKFKFVRFANKLSELIAEKKKPTILFLHDFHKIPVLEDINALLFELLSLIPKKINNIVVIIAGFEYENLRNWHNELQFKVETCDLEAILESDINVFLDLIYNNYPNKMKDATGNPILKEDYVASMKNKIMPNNTIDIEVIGDFFKRHLKILNN